MVQKIAFGVHFFNAKKLHDNNYRLLYQKKLGMTATRKSILCIFAVEPRNVTILQIAPDMDFHWVINFRQQG